MQENEPIKVNQLTILSGDSTIIQEQIRNTHNSSIDNFQGLAQIYSESQNINHSGASLLNATGVDAVDSAKPRNTDENSNTNQALDQI